MAVFEQLGYKVMSFILRLCQSEIKIQETIFLFFLSMSLMNVTKGSDPITDPWGHQHTNRSVTGLYQPIYISFLCLSDVSSWFRTR